MQSDLAALVRRQLRETADPSRAAGAQAYMKSEMPFLGVRVPQARRIALAAARSCHDADALRHTALALWDGATHREERYAGMALLGAEVVRGDLANVPVIDHMVRTGAWWDFSDDLASRVAELHDSHPEPTVELARAWSVEADMWIRRVAILSQLGRRDRVDARLLAEVIEPNRTDPEFFIRKAIGWALRDHARTDPTWVRAYVQRTELSPLSRREALKHL